MVAGGVDVGVGPFALQDADDGFCLAVRSGCVRLRFDVAEAALGDGGFEGVAGGAGPVIGHYE